MAGGVREIPLTKGHVALVDADLFDWLNQWSWQAHVKETGKVYARRVLCFNAVKTKFAMHRVIACAPPDAEVDHINGNSLDNRRANLRLATRWQNGLNTRRPKPPTSGFRGVRMPAGKRRPLYSAVICVRGRTLYLGGRPTAEEAARLYDAAAREHFGEFAVLNFPEVA